MVSEANEEKEDELSLNNYSYKHVVMEEKQKQQQHFLISIACFAHLTVGREHIHINLNAIANESIWFY